MPRHLPRPISETDLTRAVTAARSPKLRAMLTLTAWGGLRCCEVAAIDWTDLRAESDGRTFLHVRGKGNRDRVVEIGRVVVSALRAHGVRRRGPVFIGRDGARLTARSVSSSINRHLKTLGIHGSAHCLRHRFATVAYELSRDLRVVQELLGHASPITTAGYARPSDQAAAQLVAALDALAARSA